eukprot:TRINITY_DN12192_c0_g1_i10.p1 TRINITY_DN12192_c0_g1~~TRINITY_DN12192_c0_g1_i10.p1  ORF type:complete len:103 (+),score=14.04 TRINITY_DN12192_c0_g1_i10:532-840(+)
MVHQPSFNYFKRHMTSAASKSDDASARIRLLENIFIHRELALLLGNTVNQWKIRLLSLTQCPSIQLPLQSCAKLCIRNAELDPTWSKITCRGSSRWNQCCMG